MKRLAIVFVTIILLTLTTSAEKHYYGGKTCITANNALSKLVPASPTPFSCVCSCGKNCGGGCTGHCDPSCGLFACLECQLDCCLAAPAATPEECQIQ